jgi:hypothetical protein
MTSCDLIEWEDLCEKRLDPGYENLVESIRNLGFLWPVLVYRGDKDGNYNNGHHRLAAAIALNYTHIPATSSADNCGWSGGQGTAGSTGEIHGSTGPDFWKP